MPLKLFIVAKIYRHEWGLFHTNVCKISLQCRAIHRYICSLKTYHFQTWQFNLFKGALSSGFKRFSLTCPYQKLKNHGRVYWIPTFNGSTVALWTGFQHTKENAKQCCPYGPFLVRVKLGWNFLCFYWLMLLVLINEESFTVAHKGYLDIFHSHLIICDLTYSRSKLINSNTNLYLSIST